MRCIVDFVREMEWWANYSEFLAAEVCMTLLAPVMGAVTGLGGHLEIVGVCRVAVCCSVLQCVAVCCSVL